MSERYSKLFSMPENLYTEGSPVIIAAGALLKDNQTGRIIAQLKLCSISPKTIKAATVSIFPLNTMGKPLGEAIRYEYLDLNSARDTDFGSKSAIPMPDITTRSFSAAVVEVIFTDNSVWNVNDATWEALKKPEALTSRLDNEMVKQFRIEYGSEAKSFFLVQKDLWQCVCGAVNRREEKACHLCRKAICDLRDIDLDALEAVKERRLIREREQAEKEATEAKIKEAEVRKKIGKIAAVIVPALAIIIVAAVIISGMVKRANAYKDALSLMNNEQYEEAIEAFTALDDYKDSAEQIQIAENELHKLKIYNEALDFLEAREYQEAHDAFVLLEDYKDAKDYVERFSFKDVLVSETEVRDNKKIYDKYYDYDGNLMVLETLVATGNGNCGMYNCYGSDAFTLTAEHDYDISGNVTEIRVYLEDGRKVGTYTYQYDINGYLIKETGTSLHTSYEYRYENDERGNMTLRLWYQPGKTGVYDRSYNEYDEHNQLIHSGYEYEWGAKQDIIHENQYDGRNRLIRQTSVSSLNDYRQTDEYEYDASDNVIMHRSVTNNSIKEYTYEYDANGNKVKETFNSKDCAESVFHTVSITTYAYGQVFTFE